MKFLNQNYQKQIEMSIFYLPFEFQNNPLQMNYSTLTKTQKTIIQSIVMRNGYHKSVSYDYVQNEIVTCL